MLKAVIARLLGITTKLLGKHVQQTQTAGPVSQVHTAQSGNKLFAQDTKPAAQKRKPKSSVVQQGTQAALRKPKQKRAQPVAKESGQTGLPQATPASKSVKRKQKQGNKAALLDTKVTSQKPGKKSAPKKRGQPGSKRKTHV